MVPKLLAEFKLKGNGTPRVKRGSYEIRLYVKNTPSSTHLVKYRLHKSYFKRKRIVHEGEPDFEEYITSDGDFKIKAVILTRGSKKRISRWLSTALEQHYGTDESGTVRTAIERIAKNW